MVKSDPSEALVYLAQPNGQKKEIGKTPFEIPYSDLENAVPLSPATGEMIPLLFEKKNYEPLLVMVPSVRLGLSSAAVLAKLKSAQEASETAQQLLQYLHNAQKFVNSGNFDRAHNEVDMALTKSPQFIRGLSMKASIFFVQKRWDDSQAWYEKALALDNAFDEAIRMITEIKKIKGETK
jgi:tetratricopeptide (TPR) repeat protein